MSDEHSTLAPSSAHIRVNCAGSVRMSAAAPDDEGSQESKEGDAAHWAAAELLRGNTIDVGLIAPNGIMITDEMVEGAEMYAAEVFSSNTEFDGYSIHVEERVDISDIHPDCWGTPDSWRFKPYKLKVWDYKFGHRFVDVFENWQFLEYVAGVLQKVGINGISDSRTVVEMVLVQPRCYVGGAPIRRWVVMADELRGYFNTLRSAEVAALAPDAPTTVNPHCRDCKGRALCESAQRAAYDAMDVPLKALPFAMPIEAVGAELRYIDRAIQQLSARRSGLEEQALAAGKRGESVPFYDMEPSFGRERWKVPEPEVVALGEMMGVKLAVPKLITPKQAIAAGMDEELVKTFTETPRGATKLKPNDGKGARFVFGAIKDS